MQTSRIDSLDQLGRRVVLTEHPARIVSLVPSLTELLFDLGAGPRVVGRTKFCVHPANRIEAVPRVGGTKQLVLERVRACRPDLVLANREENLREDVEALAAEVPVWVSDVAELADAVALVEAVGRLIGCDGEAERLAAQVGEAYGALPQHEGRRVAYLIWQKPWMAAGGGTFVDAMLRGCGLVNVLGDRTRYPEVSADQLRDLAPDAIYLSSEPFPFKERHAEAMRAEFPGVDVRCVDGEVFSWYGTRILHARDALPRP